ncbi:Uma2 family endonuclease [Actinomadura sp. LD22]|uniref:Uma2 family endonuclease n=1 Tax=Actinomadura physcomitrii TaxID=2650748 RepID=A0A6I4MBS8_9ACTN|nr:Uma2 family endonuclease [Actinomadura physcomitrii]MWA01875.1 Uma2 family endonuclease [Actinomadura physcomitrii]
MTVMAHEPFIDGDPLLEGFLALDTPEGFRAELIDGEIIVTPPPGGRHERNIGRFARQVARRSSADLDFAANRGLVVPAAAQGPDSHVIPDGTFALAEVDAFDDEESWSRPDRVCLVLEVTSSHPERDRVNKRRAYARAGIPLYLLVDRGEQRATLFSEPDERDYGQTNSVPFGKGLALPEPFGFELDTSEFA